MQNWFIFTSSLILFQVLIGDKELDETSDLSDAASDYGELDVIPTRQGLLIESKTIIGGKNPVHGGSDGESSADSGVKEVDRDKSGYDDDSLFQENDKVDYTDSAFVSKADITVDDDSMCEIMLFIKCFFITSKLLPVTRKFFIYNEYDIMYTYFNNYFPLRYK